MNKKQEILKKIKIEYFIWIVYLVLIALSFYSNTVEKNYLYTNQEKKKEQYQQLTIFIFTIALCVYFYFFYDSYQGFLCLQENDSDKKKLLTSLSFLASTLVLISGFIYLYIATNDENMDIELAFS